MRINRFPSPADLLGQISTASFGDSKEKIVGRNGEINANSIADLARAVTALHRDIQGGKFSTDTANAETAATAEERREALAAMMANPGGEKHIELGAAIAADITDRVSRQGFMRRLLGRGELVQGSIPRFRLRRRNVEAVLATGPAQVGVQILRDNYHYPDEVMFIANPRVEQRELSQGSADVLEEKFMDSLESILVGEDRLTKRVLDKAIGIDNEIQYFSGSLTPLVVGKTKEQILRWSLPPISLIIAMDIMTDMTVGSGFSNFWEPVSKLEIILTGRIGTLLGMDLLTDGFRDPRLKVLDQGEGYITTQPDHLGAYTDRGPVQSEPRVNDRDRPGKGWFMFEEIALGVLNARGVAKFKRT